MKKVFFAFVVTAGVVLTACNNKPAATDATPAADTTAVKAAVTTTAPADSTKTMQLILLLQVLPAEQNNSGRKKHSIKSPDASGLFLLYLFQ